MIVIPTGIICTAYDVHAMFEISAQNSQSLKFTSGSVSKSNSVISGGFIWSEVRDKSRNHFWFNCAPPIFITTADISEAVRVPENNAVNLSYISEG